MTSITAGATVHDLFARREPSPTPAASEEAELLCAHCRLDDLRQELARVLASAPLLVPADVARHALQEIETAMATMCGADS